MPHYSSQYVLLLSLAVATYSCSASDGIQANPSRALYVVEDITTGKGGGGVDIRALVRLKLDRDRLTMETLLSRDQRFFSHFGGHRIALDRFVVTKYGGVIDIEAKEVINDVHDGELLGVEDRKVIYRIKNSLVRLNGLFSFDLNTRRVEKVEKGLHWDSPGEKSADRTMSVHSESGRVIWLHQIGKPPTELGRDFGFTYSRLASLSEGVPCLWLDGERILTVQTNHKLVVVNIHGVVQPFVEVKGAPGEVFTAPSLWRDKQERVIYSCGDKDFLIDVQKKKASPLERFFLGYGFEASVATDKENRRTVYHEGKAIGQWVFEPAYGQTARGVVAFPYVRPQKSINLASPHGVAVWDARVGDWRTVEMSVNSLIGWSK